MIWLINPITLLLVYIIYTRSNGLFLKLITVIGGLLDIAVNLTWFTVIFADVPKELLLTKRIERLKKYDGYRGGLANLLCKILNYFEANHCV